MHADDLADHDEGGRGEVRRRHFAFDVRQRAGDGALIARRGLRDHGGGAVARHAVLSELLHDHRQVGEPHHEDDRAVELRQRAPLDAGRFVGLMAGDERE